MIEEEALLTPVARPRTQISPVERDKIAAQYLAEREWHERILGEPDPEKRLALQQAACIETARIVRRQPGYDAPRGFSPGYLALLKPWLAGREVLEIGCGYGFALRSYAPVVKRIVGVDINPDLVEITRLKTTEWGLANVEVLCQAAQRLDFPPASFDVIFSNDVWEHLHPDDAREVARRAFVILRPGGHLIVATVNWRSGPHDVSRYWLPRGAPAAGNHLCEWGYKELDDQLIELRYTQVRGFLLCPSRKLASLGLLWLARRFPIPLKFKRVLESSPIMQSDLLSILLGLQNVLVIARKPV